MQKTVVILKELFYFSLQVSPGWISRWSESLRPILISSSDQSLLSFWQGAERMGERSPRNHWAVRLKKTLFRKYLSIHKCFEMLHLWLPTACLPYISVNLVDVIFFFPTVSWKEKASSWTKQQWFCTASCWQEGSTSLKLMERWNLRSSGPNKFFLSPTRPWSRYIKYIHDNLCQFRCRQKTSQIIDRSSVFQPWGCCPMWDHLEFKRVPLKCLVVDLKKRLLIHFFIYRHLQKCVM